MGLEIERKFTVKPLIFEKLQFAETCENIFQGYLSKNPDRTVRVRLKADKGFITIKGKKNGMSRLEFEYEIPFDDALKLIDLCEPVVIKKKRYRLIENGLCWEIDVFDAEHKGLVIAELELESDNQQIDLPDWILDDVSEDPKYFNSNL